MRCGYDIICLTLARRLNSAQLSNPESQLSRSLRESRKTKEKQRVVTDPATEQGLLSSSFARVPRVDTLSPLPEVDEYENDDFVTLYNTSKGLADAYKEGNAPKLFSDGNSFEFSQNLAKGGSPSESPSSRRPEFWTIPGVRSSHFFCGLSLDPYSAFFQWMLYMLKGPRVAFVFPEPSLMQHLVGTYFDIHNIILPILHRPTFERSLADKLHERNESFGAVVILTCAIACRYSDDPRVTHPITTSTSNTGWNLFNQVDRLRRIRLLRYQLYDAQVYAVRSPPHF